MLICGLTMLIMSSCATKIAGELLDEIGQPVEHEHGKVNITRLDSNDSQAFHETIAINQDGSFESIADILPGRYLIEALVPGFKVTSMRIDIKESKYIKLMLSPIPPVQQKAIRANLELDVGRGAGAANINPPSL